MNNKGFTILELVMIIALLLIVAGIGAPNMLQTLHKQQAEADDSQLYQLNDATQSYAMVSGQSLFYNDTNFVFKDCISGGSLDTDLMLNKLMENGYIIAMPESEQNGGEFKWNVVAMKWEVEVN